MTVMQEVEFEYEVGEEVVVHLPADAGSGRSAAGWTIGEIVERLLSEGRPLYAVRFVEGDGVRTIRVHEGAIEGTA